MSIVSVNCRSDLPPSLLRSVTSSPPACVPWFLITEETFARMSVSSDFPSSPVSNALNDSGVIAPVERAAAIFTTKGLSFSLSRSPLIDSATAAIGVSL